MKRWNFSFQLLLLFFAETANAGPAQEYVVRQGDTLSQIAQRLLPELRVYGKHGSVAKLLALNPHLREPDVIAVNERIAFPATKRLVSSKEAAAESIVKKPEDSPEQISAGSSVLTLGSYFYYSTTQGRDLSSAADATLVSKLNKGLSLAWAQHWSPRVSTILFGGVAREEYAASGSSSSAIHDGKQTLTHLGAALRWNFSSLLYGKAEGRKESVVYHRGISSGQGITFETIEEHRLGLALGIRLLDIKPFAWSAEIGGYWKSRERNSYYQTRAGPGYRLGMEVAQEFTHTKLIGDIFYRWQRQNTSIADAHKSELGIGLAIGWKLGE